MTWTMARNLPRHLRVTLSTLRSGVLPVFECPVCRNCPRATGKTTKTTWKSLPCWGDPALPSRAGSVPCAKVDCRSIPILTERIFLSVYLRLLQRRLSQILMCNRPRAHLPSGTTRRLLGPSYRRYGVLTWSFRRGAIEAQSSLEAIVHEATFAMKSHVMITPSPRFHLRTRRVSARVRRHHDHDAIPKATSMPEQQANFRTHRMRVRCLSNLAILMRCGR